jgi:hypothetical protein
MATLPQLLNDMTVTDIKSLLRLLPGNLPNGRKELLIEAMCERMGGDNLKPLWDKLDNFQQLAVAEVLYHPRGMFEGSKFVAKYGQYPAFTEIIDKTARYPQKRNTALHLFLYQTALGTGLPDDLRQPLQAFVPQPAPNALHTVATLPDTCNDMPLQLRQTESEALTDLPALLRLIDQGQISVSEKTGLPGSGSTKLLAEKLSGGDYYTPEDSSAAARSRAYLTCADIGPIKAFAWPLLLQAAGLAQINGKKLGLSKTGIKALASPAPATLRAIWQKWVKATLFDEFGRVDAIKGQKSAGRVMTAPAGRRAIIQEALRQCPVGQWISVDEWSRFMQAADYQFLVCHDEWKLYLCELRYGSLGMNHGVSNWNMLQLRYLLCLLFEYCAPLGMVELAYTLPHEARDDFSRHWGADELAFLSRYDGLMFFRLTALGQYCLGAVEQYQPQTQHSLVQLSVQSNLLIKVTEGQASADEVLLLENWASQESESSWRLDRQKAMQAIERGFDGQQLLEFLRAHDNQPLPQQVEHFVHTNQRQGQALRHVAASLLLECVDADIARKIASHPDSKGLCLLAGERHLVVRCEHESRFRDMVHRQGWGIVAAGKA